MLRFDFLRALRILFTDGPLSLLWRLRVGTYARMFAESIHAKPWSESLDRLTAMRLHAQCKQQSQFSLIVDARNTTEAELQRCLDSVAAQLWSEWQVLLLVTPSQDLLESSLTDDNRVTVLPVAADSSMSDCWNSAIPAAQGDWIGMLPIDAALSADALTWLLISANRWPDAQCLYSDSVTLNRKGRCVDSQFKPDFSPEYLLASHFTGDLTVFRLTGIQALGGLQEGFGEAARYDLELRLVDRFGRDAIRHVGRAICHKRGSLTSSKPAVTLQHVHAASESLTRRGVDAQVVPHPVARNVNRIELAPASSPHVTIYIATRNSATLVKNCVQSIRQHTGYSDYDIVVINNRSDERELLDWLAEESAADRLSVFDYDRPFNHSEMHNLVMEQSASEFVVLLNNDIEIVSDDWLEQLVATAQLDPSVGSVGALLQYPNKTVQHAGIVTGFRGMAGHFYRGLALKRPGYNGRLHALQEVSACTAAMLLLRRSAFQDVGGFDSLQFPTSLNDVDLGLRLRRDGYRCIYNPAVQAIHFESYTRRIDYIREKKFHAAMRKQWLSELQHDPFHNRNVSLFSDSFRLFRSNRPDVDAIEAELAQSAVAPTVLKAAADVEDTVSNAA